MAVSPTGANCAGISGETDWCVEPEPTLVPAANDEVVTSIIVIAFCG